MDIEKLLKTLYQEIRKDKPQGDCLTDEDFACFLDNRLSRKERKLFSKHLASCTTCADQLKDHLLISEAVHSKPVLEAPQGLVDKAKSLVSSEPKPNFFDIILNFTQDAIQLVKTTGEVLSPGTIPVLRTSAKNESFLNQIKIVKAFKNLTLQVQVEKKGRHLADITVSITEAGKRKGSADFRISLFKNEREIGSKLTERGKTTFEELSLGEYKILVTKEGVVSSMIDVTLNSKP